MILPPGKTLDSDISYARTQVLMLWWDACLHVSGEYGDALGVRSATHVPYNSRSQNIVLCTKLLVTLLFVTFSYVVIRTFGWVKTDIYGTSNRYNSVGF